MTDYIYEVVDMVPEKAHRTAPARDDIDYAKAFRLAFSNPGSWVKVGPFGSHSNSLALIAKSKKTMGLSAVARTTPDGLFVFVSDGDSADD